MRKSLIYAFTAAAMTAAGAAAPMTAQAAVNTYTLPGGNGQAIVISGNLNSFNCENGFPGIQLPDNMFPGNQIPGSMLPDNLFPIPDFGGQGGTMAVSSMAVSSTEVSPGTDKSTRTIRRLR